MDLLLPLVLVVGVMWLMTNRNRKQQRAAADFRANLTVGQEVMTGSGLFGTIVAVDGDTITLESTPGNQTRWIRAAVSKLVPPAEELAEDTEDTEDFTDEAVDEDAFHDGTSTADDVPGRGGATAAHVDRDGIVQADVPDDLSTLDERRPGDGPEHR
jgi:preprotein translocase subunit YajC